MKSNKTESRFLFRRLRYRLIGKIPAGKRILKRRRKKGRKRLTVSVIFSLQFVAKSKWL